jgi:16S rRNA (guanine(966)-N(2))-methyltransferase RsmD
MRIIQGSHRGRKLQSKEVEDLRPMRAQVRAALFNILNARSARVSGSRFLDLFAGTGSVGIEALSRGAAWAVFVDQSREAVRLIEANLEALKLSERAVIYHEDAMKALAQLDAAQQRFDLVFIGPPYGQGLANRALAALAETHILNDDALVITEIFKKETLPEAFGGLKRSDLRRYGDNVLVFYRWTAMPSSTRSTHRNE